MNLGAAFKKFGPTILTAIGITGIGVTSWLTYKGTKKAVKMIDDSTTKKEEFKATWKCYIPAAISGTVTVACIVAGKTMDGKQIAMLAGTAGASGKLLAEYKEKIRERFGDEGLDDIRRDIAKDHEDGIPVASIPCINTGYFGFDKLSDEMDDETKCNTLFYDEFNDKWFYSTTNNVRAALYYLNRNHSMTLYSTVSDFYEFLGVDIDAENGMREWGNEYLESTEQTWIDASLIKSMKKDGTPYYIIDYWYVPDIPEVLKSSQ